MSDTQPRGYWTANLAVRDYDPLVPGRAYRVIRPFTDFDGHEHRVGERWTFITYNYSPYDDGLSLFVAIDDDSEIHIRMQQRPEEQAAVIDALGDYIVAE